MLRRPILLLSSTLINQVSIILQRRPSFPWSRSLMHSSRTTTGLPRSMQNPSRDIQFPLWWAWCLALGTSQILVSILRAISWYQDSANQNNLLLNHFSIHEHYASFRLRQKAKIWKFGGRSWDAQIENLVGSGASFQSSEETFLH